MSRTVPFTEAVEILHWISAAPGRVRAVRDFDAGTFGLLPFFVDWRGAEAEVTLSMTGGVITGLASIRIGPRYANAHDWIGEAEGDPLDELGDVASQLLELSLKSAAAQA